MRPLNFEERFTITDAALADFLDKNAERIEEEYDRDYDRLYNHPEQVRVSMIRLVLDGDGPLLADLRPVLENLREQVENGADFSDLARRWSEDPSALKGGDQGLRPVPQLSISDQEQLEDLEVGQLTKVFATDTDVRLLRVEERIEPSVDAFDDVRDQIAERMIRSENVPKMAADFAKDQLLEQWRTTGEVPQGASVGVGAGGGRLWTRIYAEHQPLWSPPGASRCGSSQ